LFDEKNVERDNKTERKRTKSYFSIVTYSIFDSCELWEKVSENRRWIHL